MSDRDVLLQICPNDAPPFADICCYYESAALELGWQPVTVMLERRAPAPTEDFHYPIGPLRREIRRLLGGRRPRLTVCHRHRAYRTLMASGLAAAPVVLVAHEFGLLARRRRRLRLAVDPLLGRPRVILAGVSEPVAEDLRRRAGHAIVLPNGIDLARCDARRLDTDAARRHLGLLRDEFTVGVVGRLHPKKDPALAVEAFRLVRERSRAAMRLVFLGDGQLAADLEARGADLPVLFKGFVADAPRYMAAFDLLVLPSGAREAFGMVALEAMAAGVPVLCGPSPGPRFVVGDAGLMFEPHTPGALAEALERARAGEAGGDRLAEVARRARRRAELEFSVAAAARRLEQLVQ